LPLQLTLTKAPTTSTVGSLASLLAKHHAGAMQLILGLRPPYSHYAPGWISAAGEAEAWLSQLSIIGHHVKSLDMPTCTLMSTMAVACTYLTNLQELWLRLNEGSKVAAGCWTTRRAEQLKTLILSVDPGEPPFCFSDLSSELLDLTSLPALEHLVVRGPIVKQGEECAALCLPGHAKVSSRCLS